MYSDLILAGTFSQPCQSGPRPHDYAFVFLSNSGGLAERANVSAPRGNIDYQRQGEARHFSMRSDGEILSFNESGNGIRTTYGCYFIQSI